MPYNNQYKDMNGIALAYLGDCVLELEVRKFLLSLGFYDSASLNKHALKFVRASCQSKAFEKIEPVLSDDEQMYYKRGRNTHGMKTPKSATAVEYRRATGFEALFAYLYLTEQTERINELFYMAFNDEISELKCLSDNKKES